MAVAPELPELPCAVAPGQRLGDVEEVLAGPGTYAESGFVYASVSGEARLGPDATLEVTPAAASAGGAVPGLGTTVVAHVVRLSQERADCTIVAVGDTPLAEKFRGVIRKQDVRFFEIDKIRLVDCFRVGDFVRARVLALGDTRSYVLTTAASDTLGVIAARSAAGAALAPISWQYMKCPLTGRKEKRKVAKPY
uniref:S1 motif domain-containing protein n=1 Tax=Alexandrium monilatum TaxID=311494 RepID=A0A7S4PXK6_9DINO|mmetsp:Transcript_55428/g.164791  ORF Transcript_55428/g.164791 Transcript_55428/m.164791 type:complete len:194 (+) Transcript_55428:21-602(+)